MSEILSYRSPLCGKGSVACADGQLYLRSEAGTVALVEATPHGYHEKGTFEQPDRSNENAWPHPVIAGGYARGELRPFRVSLLRGRNR